MNATNLQQLKDDLLGLMGPHDRWRSIGYGGVLETGDGRKVEMHGCESSVEARKYMGRAHDLKCVARGTMILMGDGSYVPVEGVRPGDSVMTLQGPKLVLRTIRKGVRPCVAVRVDGVTTVVSADHQMLTPFGWASPSALRPSGRRVVFATPPGCDGLSRAAWTPRGSRPPGRPPIQVVGPIWPPAAPTQATDAWLIGAETAVESSCESSPETGPPLSWSAPLVLHAPAARSAGSCWPEHDPGYALGGGRRPSSTPGWPPGCRGGRGFCGGRPPCPAPGGGPGYIPSPGGAVEFVRPDCNAGGRARTPGCTRSRVRYTHPYTRLGLVSSEPALVREAEMAPAGEAEVFDLTVESAAHYISYGGIIQRNCWDELPTFTEEVFRFVNAWNRTTERGQRCRVVGAGNPPTRPEEEWVIKYWAPWLDPQHPNPAIPGEVRWFCVIDGEDVEVESGAPFAHGRETIIPRSRTFIPARLEDNPDLERQGYRAVLQGLPEPLRSQLLYGDMAAGRADDDWQLLPTEWVRASMRQWRDAKRPKCPLTAAALDCAMGGEDHAVLAKLYDRWVAPLKAWAGKDMVDGPTAMVRVLPELDSLKCPFLVDIGATAGGSTVTAFKMSFETMPVRPVNFGSGSGYKDKTGRFEMANLRAEMYWRLREALDPAGGEVLLLPDDRDLMSELCSIRWRPAGIGKAAVEPKADIKKRLGRSTDRADAVAMLALTFRNPNGGWLRPKDPEPRPTTVPRPFAYKGGAFMGVGGGDD